MYPYILEKQIISLFENNFNLIAGREYFEGDINEMLTDFLKLKTDHDKNYNKTNNIVNNSETNITKIKLPIFKRFKCKYCLEVFDDKILFQKHDVTCRSNDSDF